ncbi:hypothetical protein [Arsenicibacter rosenii]|uniref:Uncharacterized protein n=1 Tax=Arsenicibacter rosenii TaxID=1750698 RepID=A0A1S2VAV5_9BACT|nr:hypothetical protein [Arsenicibacter rosenii]OIN55877.1 hypothetical protein BLX24_27875 [Arsenicibacter rosenii]
MKTIHWSVTLSVSNDFFSSAELKSDNYLKTIAAIWQQHARLVHVETDIYISAVLTPSRNIFSEDQGCPAGGRNAVTLSGVFAGSVVHHEVYQRQIAALSDIIGRTAASIDAGPANLLFSELYSTRIEIEKDDSVPSL